MNRYVLTVLAAVGIAAALPLLIARAALIAEPAELEGISIGDTKNAALAAFHGAGAFTFTCFGERAVFGDKQRKDGDYHVMAFLDEESDRVTAVEVNSGHIDVPDRAQCADMVRSTAKRVFGGAEHAQSLREAHLGAARRFYVRWTTSKGLSHEIWADHSGAHSYQSCKTSWRISLEGRERLNEDGERNRPGIPRTQIR